MFRKYLIPPLSIVGIVFAIMVVRASSQAPVPAPPVAPPARATFESYIVGAGLVEASTENIAIAPTVPGVVKRMAVSVGSVVKVGDVLFELDDREMRAERAVRQASLEQAKARLQRLEAQPRPEEVPPAEADVQAAKAELENAQVQWKNAEGMVDVRAISDEERARRQWAQAAAEARLSRVSANLTLLRAGAWESDMAVAQAEVASAEAQLAAADVALDRLVVKAPVAGTILQSNLRVGEFAPTGLLSEPLMILGDISTLHVRVDIDENDAWRFRESAPAEAFLRGNSALKAALRFVRIEPFVVPKKSLTGDSTERVDTRVMQVIYAFDRNALPILVGQQMDVFVEALSVEAATKAAVSN